ncbi:SDR family oxidoreductase [Mycobacterium intracellulare]|uniref:NAD(P)H-binding protein n=1 Tax=Mycobacterium intracellulare subsp. chimaera TaxID=222805 RepID=A0A220YD59_MYCIT|nr:NAD(P)H-binding protein [Mycobacterium intracellulare]AOS92179.1 NmrA family transcriptional regulator [Mycobacterium intracellulare subsp. chimaera]ARV82292.1 NmrA family transcriptional regulator [Mycobacterium intracellulare subsp. chimaera]ASL09539.1 putative nucleoside-diphosphate sugar epimerase [Mycobacterium intracellulare subsp. chimaera]ASL15228.1 putative nucleoside-diphosphate sugar epimerase [Mycobacterium intracellulare subsp. chimaera]ASL21342.1 putative nucleoside-diphosphat
MTNCVLVTGGTGTVGRVVVDQLTAAGKDVRVLSRGRRPNQRADVEHVVGDVQTGAGLDAALDGVDTIVHCVYPAENLVAAAKRAGSPHLLYVSIVGIDRVPFAFYRRMLANERTIAGSGVPWTVLRATQFHDLIAFVLRVLAKPPVMALPSGLKFQPVDVRDVGERLAGLALGEPIGRAPDFGGPQARTLDDLARSYLAIAGRRRPMAPIRLPGKVFGGIRGGGLLTPEHAAGTITFEQYLEEQQAAGRLPYRDAIRAYLRRR